MLDWTSVLVSILANPYVQFISLIATLFGSFSAIGYFLQKHIARAA